MALLRLRIDTFRHDDRNATDLPLLQDLDVEVRAGEVLAVTGGSGSGKSTLGQIMAGILPDGGGRMQGTVELGGERVEYSPHERRRTDLAEWARHAAYLPQDARSYFSGARATVEEEIAFGLEYRGLPRREQRADVGRVVEALGLEDLLDRDPLGLSGGQERLVALACLLVLRPQVVVLDEPGAGLDRAVGNTVREAIDALMREGVGTVILAGSDEPFLETATRRLDLGPAASERSSARVPTAPTPAAPRNDAVPRLELRGVDAFRSSGPRPVIENVELSVAPGECVAVTGANGTGKSTVARAVMGVERFTGTIRIDGRPAPRKTADIARSVAIMLQNPADQLSARTVRRHLLAGARTRKDADQVLADCGLDDASDEHPFELCASQRRLLTLAAAVARRTPVLILDEPTVGLDAAGRRILADQIGRCLARGAAVLLITHDVAFAEAVAHREVRLGARE